MKNIALLIIATLFSICGFGQLTAKQQDSVARNLTPPEGEALVYIVRPTTYGFAIEMDVHCDTAYIGTTSQKSYLYTLLTPGKYLFTSKAENKSKLELEVEAGKTYFIEQQVKMGIIYARAHLNPVTEEAGRKFLRKCKLEKSNAYHQ